MKYSEPAFSPENIKKLMQLKGMSRENDLARETGISQSTINRILSGAASDPKISIIKEIASFFDVSLEEVIGDTPLKRITSFGQDAPLENENATKVTKIPIIHWEQVSKHEEVLSKLIPKNWDKWVMTDRNISENSYALKITTDSMNMPFNNGTILIVDADSRITDGNHVIFTHKTREKFVRIGKVFVLGSEKFVQTLDPLNEQILIGQDGDINVCGVIKQWQINSEK